MIPSLLSEILNSEQEILDDSLPAPEVEEVEVAPLSVQQHVAGPVFRNLSGRRCQQQVRVKLY